MTPSFLKQILKRFYIIEAEGKWRKYITMNKLRIMHNIK